MLGRSQRHHTVCHARVFIGKPTVQLVSRGKAAVQFFDLIQQLHNENVLHADMQLSTHSNDCWSAHILSAMDGLT